MTRSSGVPWSLLVALALPVSAGRADAQTGVTDLAGRGVTPIDLAAPATVLLFTAVECPISDRYAPAVRRLAERYAAPAFASGWSTRMRASRPPPSERTPKRSRTDCRWRSTAPATLADLAEATVTPEAAVFDQARPAPLSRTHRRPLPGLRRRSPRADDPRSRRGARGGARGSAGGGARDPGGRLRDRAAPAMTARALGRRLVLAAVTVATCGARSAGAQTPDGHLQSAHRAASCTRAARSAIGPAAPARSAC